MSRGIRFLRSGKVKDIYELDEQHLLFHFTNRVSAFDVVLPSTIPRKGEVLCRFSEYWFRTLAVPHHMVRFDGRDKMVVQKLRMIPVECVARGYLYGSFYERVKKGRIALPMEPVLAAKLPEPVFDPTTKSDKKDVPVSEPEILAAGWVDKDQLALLKQRTLAIYGEMAERAERTGFILADLKLEYGWDKDGTIVLADSIGPDEFRLWHAATYLPGRVQEAYDKQPIRDWLASVRYKDLLDEAFRQGLPPSPSPALPPELIEETSRRYITAYEKLTGLSFD
jgi:phosphoribosylaminoimidazole-succinocarboxamide synthase